MKSPRGEFTVVKMQLHDLPTNTTAEVFRYHITEPRTPPFVVAAKTTKPVNEAEVKATNTLHQYVIESLVNPNVTNRSLHVMIDSIVRRSSFCSGTSRRPARQWPRT